MEMAKTIFYLLAGIAVHCFNKKNEGKRMWISRKKFTSIEKKISELERAVQARTTPEDVKKTDKRRLVAAHDNQYKSEECEKG